MDTTASNAPDRVQAAEYAAVALSDGFKRKARPCSHAPRRGISAPRLVMRACPLAQVFSTRTSSVMLGGIACVAIGLSVVIIFDRFDNNATMPAPVDGLARNSFEVNLANERRIAREVANKCARWRRHKRRGPHTNPLRAWAV